jgi:hypothetical protein
MTICLRAIVFAFFVSAGTFAVLVDAVAHRTDWGHNAYIGSQFDGGRALSDISTVWKL